MVPDAAFLSCTPSCLCISPSRIFGEMQQPAPLDQQPQLGLIHPPTLHAWLFLATDWPTQQAASAPRKLTACCVHISRLSGHHHLNPAASWRSSRTTSHHLSVDASREPAQGVSVFTRLSLSTLSAQRTWAHSTPLYHHLGIRTFNQWLSLFFSL